MMKQFVPHLKSNDVKKSIDYFKNALNFNVYYTQTDDDGKMDFAILKKDSIELMISGKYAIEDIDNELGSKPIGASVIFYIQMQKVKEYYIEVKDKVKLRRKIFDSDWGTTEFWIEDADGYIFSFFEQH